MRDERVKKLALGGLFAALVLLATYVLRVPSNLGYIHLGDGVIFLSAMFMGDYAALTAGVGSALADLLGGYFYYIGPTFLIKAAMGLMAARMTRPGRHLRNLLTFLAAEVAMVAGYFLFESFVYGWAAALSGVPFNLLQGAAGVALGMAFSLYLPHLKKKL